VEEQRNLEELEKEKTRQVEEEAAKWKQRLDAVSAQLDNARSIDREIPMSDEKVLTEKVDASGWFIDPMTDRFHLQSKKFFISVIHSPSLFSICSVQPPGTGLRDMHEDFEELDEEDARLILLSIKDSLDRALAGEDFELNIEPWPQRKKVKKVLIPEGHIWVSTGPEANDGYIFEIEVLTNEIVKQFIAESVETRDDWWIPRDFDNFTEIEDEAAESFRKHSELAQTDADCWCEMQLSLSHLTGLSDAAAESLGKFTGEQLWLERLTQLSGAAAESLSNYDGVLHLTLDNLPESAAGILRNHPSFAEEDDED